MKKKAAALLLGAMVVMALAGCGEKKDSAEGTEVVESTEGTGTVKAVSSAFDLGGENVKLCDYDKIEVTITGDYDVDDNEVKEYFANMFAQYGPFYKEDPEKTTVGEGDIVNVDYVGKLDGKAFDGGSAENQSIDVDNNSAAGGGTGFIEGFTDGLKGASVGDVIDSNVTFPENYGNADLAGKDVVFTFTVNSIQKEMTIDDVDDAFAKEQFQVETVDEMYEQLGAALRNEAENKKRSDIYSEVQDYLLENSTAEVPKDYMEARMSDFRRQYINSYCEGDESKLEEYLSTYYGKTVEAAEEEWSAAMEKNIRLEYILGAIADEKGIKLDEEGASNYINSMAQSTGADTETLFERYGYGDKEYGEKYLKQLYVYDKALAEVVDSASVTEKPAGEGTDAKEAIEGTENADGTESQAE